jgi:hypothetical protein
VSRQQAQKKICLNFEREFFITSVWLQAGQYLAHAAQIPAKQKSGCRPLRLYRIKAAATYHIRHQSHRPNASTCCLMFERCLLADIALQALHPTGIE